MTHEAQEEQDLLDAVLALKPSTKAEANFRLLCYQDVELSRLVR